MAARRFRVTPNQFQVFKYTRLRRAIVHVEMIATEAVGMMVLDSDNFYEYDKGSLSTFEVERSWPPKGFVKDRFPLGAGTWYIIVEGYKATSEGRIQISP